MTLVIGLCVTVAVCAILVALDLLLSRLQRVAPVGPELVTRRFWVGLKDAWASKAKGWAEEGHRAQQARKEGAPGHRLP